MSVGTEVKITGRVQSRTYEKKYEDGTIEQRVAYEVSVGNLELIDAKDAEGEGRTDEAIDIESAANENSEE